MIIAEIEVNSDGFYVIPKELSGKRVEFRSKPGKPPILLVFESEEEEKRIIFIDEKKVLQ